MRSFENCAGAQDRAIFHDEITDQALELAACVPGDGTANITIAFCSGLDECPHPLPRRYDRRLAV